MIGYDELRAAAKVIAGKAVAPRRIASYIVAHETLRMNIGCGHNTLDGWLNVDIEHGGVRSNAVWLDATVPFPVASGLFKAVLCEHMIEHIPKTRGKFLVAEVFRVLQPGGKFRVITPDLDAMFDLYRNPLDDRARGYLDFVARIHDLPSITPGEAVNLMFREYGHQHIYSITELNEMFEQAGFIGLVVGRAGFPTDPIFQGVEGHVSIMGADNNAFEAFAIEATKPEAGGGDRLHAA